MATTVPVRSEQINAGGTTNADYIDAIHDWIATAPGAFTIENVVGSPVTSFTLTHGDGWQLNFELDSGQVFMVIAPDGGITDSTDPTAAANTSPRDVVLPTPSGTAQLITGELYADALFFGIHNTASTAYPFAFHPGKIIVPDDLSDAALGVDGLGVLANIPSETASSLSGLWFSTNGSASNRKSWVRVGTNEWSNPVVDRNFSGISAGPTSRRVASMGLVVAAPGSPSSQSSSAHIGRLKYVRADVQGTLAPLAIRPSGTTDQGWLSISNSTSATRMRILHDRTETP